MAAGEGCQTIEGKYQETTEGKYQELEGKYQEHYKVLSIGRTSPTGDPHRYPLAKEKSQHPKNSEDFQECG